MKQLADAEVLAFIAGSFRSAWTVELLCLLRSEPERVWAPHELVLALCASELVVRQGTEALTALGVVVPDEYGNVRYATTPLLDAMLDAVEKLYRTAPDAVRRAIVRGSSPSMIAFADAFRFRSDD